MYRLSQTALLVALLLLLASEAFAQTPARRTGSLSPATLSPSSEPPTARFYHESPPEGTPTAVSGRTADSVDHVNDQGRTPIYAIEMGERSDVPCHIQIFHWSGEDRNHLTKTMNRCSSSATSSSLQRIGYADSQVAPNRSLKALRGLQVCSNNRSGANYRVKGLRVFAARLTEVDNGDSGTLTVQANSSADAAFERPNCRRWEQVRTCPSGQMMIDVDVHYRMDGSRREITGLAPRCARVTFTDVRTDVRDDG